MRQYYSFNNYIKYCQKLFNAVPNNKPVPNILLKIYDLKSSFCNQVRTKQLITKQLITKESNKYKSIYSAIDTLFSMLYFYHRKISNRIDEPLVKKLPGISYETIKDFLSINVSPTPCVYLFVLGKAKEMKDNQLVSSYLVDVPDNNYICKFGRTKDLASRSYRHKITYGDHIRLAIYAKIDLFYLVNAENSIISYFKNNNNIIKYESKKEIVSLSPQQFKEAKKYYADIEKDFNKSLNDIKKENEITKKSYQLSLERQHVMYKEFYESKIK